MTSRGKTTNQVRIIGGQWRGRKLSFADLPGLRPSPDRIRETLFNWLQPYISGARCLELFAGSGVIGLEALSRGAREVVQLDAHPVVIRQLQQNRDLLKAQGLVLWQGEALAFLKQPPAHIAPGFDIVFLDPPFRQGLLAPAITALEQGHWLNDGALVYIESERELTHVALPPHWQLLREKAAGQIIYRLAQRPSPAREEQA